MRRDEAGRVGRELYGQLSERRLGCRFEGDLERGRGFRFGHFHPEEDVPRVQGQLGALVARQRGVNARHLMNERAGKHQVKRVHARLGDDPVYRQKYERPDWHLQFPLAGRDEATEVGLYEASDGSASRRKGDVVCATVAQRDLEVSSVVDVVVVVVLTSQNCSVGRRAEAEGTSPEKQCEAAGSGRNWSPQRLPHPHRGCCSVCGDLLCVRLSSGQRENDISL